MATKDLDKVIQIGEEEYNVNAVNADHATNADSAKDAESAAKVDKKFIINRKAYNGSEQKKVEFDGSKEVSINLVTADEGGAFMQRIEVPKDDRANITDNAVLNYGDLKKLLFNTLKTHSASYAWDGSALSGTPSATGTLLGVSIVTGSEDARLSFGIKNVSNFKIPAYLYISDQHYIYYGTASESTMYCLSSKDADQAAHADQADTAISIISTNDPTLPAYSHAYLRGILSSLQAQITAFTKNIGYTAVSAAERLMIDETSAITGEQIKTQLDQLDNDFIGLTYGLTYGSIAAYTADRLGGVAASEWQRKILTGTVDPNSSTANTTIKNAPTGSIYIRYST